VVVGLLMTGSIATHIYFSQHPGASPTDWLSLIPEKKIVVPIITVLLWAWGYFKMRRQQV
ncbi:MAG: hypothetical protein LBC49_00125, partial [Bacteroidales bacterium]|nr:hypothetical protein [Bacteroidales bacterium]